MAFSRSDSRRALATWDEGVAFVREHKVHFFEGFLARDAERLHRSDSEPDAALVFAETPSRHFIEPEMSRKLIITLSSVPATVRRARAVRGGLNAPRRYVPGTSQIPSRPRDGRSRRWLSPISEPRRQRDPRPRVRVEPPSGLSRSEPEVLRCLGGPDVR